MREYKNEKEFLEDYDDSIFKKPSLTTDILVFSVSESKEDNYRKLTSKKLSVLLVKRDNYPFKDKWCLPGGFIKMDETTEESSKRILENETNIKELYLEQLYTLSNINRDPRTRVISVSYIALVDQSKYSEISDSARWFDLYVEEEDNTYCFTLCSKEDKLTFILKKHEDKFITIKNDDLAFDHPEVIGLGLQRIKNKIEYTDIAFSLMPKYFTLGELQQVYEVILGKKLLDPAFRRIISHKVKKTNKVKTGVGHRPSVLYQFKK
jgi:8-oxo-dGTP diphosphatase